MSEDQLRADIPETAKRQDGGPAYPVVAGHNVYSHGMLLRDWFAGQALAGMGPMHIAVIREQWGADRESEAKRRAEMAYAIADAMLAARDAS